MYGDAALDKRVEHVVDADGLEVGHEALVGFDRYQVEVGGEGRARLREDGDGPPVVAAALDHTEAV